MHGSGARLSVRCKSSLPADGEGLQFSQNEKSQPAVLHQENTRSLSAHLLQGAFLTLINGRKRNLLVAKVEDDVPGRAMTGDGTGARDVLSGEGAGTAASPKSPPTPASETPAPVSETTVVGPPGDSTSRRQRFLIRSGTSSGSSSEAVAAATPSGCFRDDDCEAASLSLPEGSSPSGLLETPTVCASPSPSGASCPTGSSSGWVG